jgi:hypothetical protein
VLSLAKLQAAVANGSALVAVAEAIGGGFWAKAMALAIALSVIATTGTSAGKRGPPAPTRSRPALSRR